MIQAGLIEKLLELDQIAKTDSHKYPLTRFLYPRLEYLLLQTRQLTGIAGLRGTGKTILLRQLAASLQRSLYLSADTLPPGTNLFDLGKYLNERFHIDYLLIDEIHAIPGWKGQLKQIYDFSSIHLAFTSSAALELSESKYDLSRRLTLEHLPLFSFREYLQFRKKGIFPVITLQNILVNPAECYATIFPFEADFWEYASMGAMPACLESPLSSVITSIVDKAVYRDLLSIGKLTNDDLLQIRSVLLFIARSGIDGCSYSSISRNTGITKYKARQYIELLEAAAMLHVVLPYGSNVMPEPKILLVPTLRANLAQGLDEDRFRGAIREEFFIHHLRSAGITVNYLKSLRGEKLPDYMVFQEDRKLIMEIGGAGKGPSQFKGIGQKEKFIFTQPGSFQGIPLILTGFLF